MKSLPTEGMDANPKSLLETKRRDRDVRLFKSDNPHGNFGDAVRGRSRLAAPIDAAVRSDTLSFLHQIAIKLCHRLRWDPVKEDFVGDTEASALLDRPRREPWELSTAA